MSSNNIYINHFGYALPETSFSVEESALKGKTFSSAELLLDAGFRRHHVCTETESPYDLARRAVQLIAQINSVDLIATDVILYATCLICNGNLGAWGDFQQSKDVKPLMDFPVSHLQSDFDMDKAFVLGLNQTACTSLLGALRVARALMISEPQLKQILCLTADRFPEGAIYEQGYNLISDGSASCLLSREPGPFKLIDCHHLSNGAMAQATDDETAGFYFNYTYRLIQEILERNTLDLADVQWIVPQNTNIKAWQVLASVLRYDLAKILMPTREDIGHCISGDNIINLKIADEQGYFKPGDKILMPMAGFGLNWSCVLLQKES